MQQHLLNATAFIKCNSIYLNAIQYFAGLPESTHILGRQAAQATHLRNKSCGQNNATATVW